MQYIARADTGKQVFAASGFDGVDQCYGAPLPQEWKREEQLDLKPNESFVEAANPEKFLAENNKPVEDPAIKRATALKKKLVKTTSTERASSSALKKARILDDFFDL